MKRRNINNTIYYFIILLLIILIISIFKYNIENFQVNESYDIFIIAGQSNAIGRGTRNTIANYYGSDPINNPTDDAANNNIKQYNNNATIVNALHPIPHLEGFNNRSSPVVLNGPLTGSSTNNCNKVGFGLTFAKKYLQLYRNKSNPKVLLVGCGYGGTGFGYASKSRPLWWDPTDNNNYRFSDGSVGKVSSLYLYTIQKLREMKNVVGANSKVKGILWLQGETNAENNDPNYNSKIQTLFTNLRTTIATLFPTSGTVPILMGGLCPDNYRNRVTGVITPNSYKTMSDLIQNTIVPSIPNCRFVSTEPTPTFPTYLQGDAQMNASGNIVAQNQQNIHYSATSLRELGKRYFSIFNTI